MLQSDKWLSQYIGNVFRYLPPFDQAEWPRGLVYAKLDSSDISNFNYLTKQGFELVEVLLFFSQKDISEKIQRVFVVRESTADDQQQVIEIARNSFTNSRFHKDSRISLASANQLKADWAGNYFNGKRGNRMFVAESSGKIIGFIQLLNKTIDLIAVDNNFKENGIGSAMIARANEEVGVLQAGTQSTNVSAVKMYQSNGFRFSNAQLVMHKWVL